jgi:hypothetical protein
VAVLGQRVRKAMPLILPPVYDNIIYGWPAARAA